ncbi:hypothetical protein BWR22_09685 [Lacinutrix venerupis]|uniref:Uncharacterized protein n=1 Tax=Lacinutrix venerupis TaxID=1486034 RepID=A0AAC9LLC4_9FLAO|nr:hypothetical protein BWR22_09685 [Lacinutrix venerupis]
MNVAFAFTSVAIALSGCKYTTYFLLRKLLFNLFLILFLQTLLKASNQHIIHPIFFKFFSTICPYYIYTIFNGKITSYMHGSNSSFTLEHVCNILLFFVYINILNYLKV